MWWMNLIVGSKWAKYAVTALVVILISVSVIQYIQLAERDKLIVELQEKQIKKREKIDEAVKRSNTPTSDDALLYLRERQGAR